MNYKKISIKHDIGTSWYGTCQVVCSNELESKIIFKILYFLGVLNYYHTDPYTSYKKRGQSVSYCLQGSSCYFMYNDFDIDKTRESRVTYKAEFFIKSFIELIIKHSNIGNNTFIKDYHTGKFSYIKNVNSIKYDIKTNVASILSNNGYIKLIDSFVVLPLSSNIFTFDQIKAIFKDRYKPGDIVKSIVNNKKIFGINISSTKDKTILIEKDEVLSVNDKKPIITVRDCIVFNNGEWAKNISRKPKETYITKPIKGLKIKLNKINIKARSK